MSVTDIVQSVILLVLGSVATAAFFGKANKAECELRHQFLAEEKKDREAARQEMRKDIKEIKDSIGKIENSLAREGFCGSKND